MKTLAFVVAIFALSYYTQAQQLSNEYVTIEQKNENFIFYLYDSPSPIFSIPNQQFLQIGKSNPSVKEVYGFFKFKEKIDTWHKNQSIDTFYTHNKQAIVAGTIGNTTYQFILQAIDSFHCTINISLADSSYNRLLFFYTSDKDEAIFGLGEQYTHTNLKGKKVPIWVEEQGIGAGDQPITAIANIKIAGGTPVSTYAPIPFYLSNRNYSFLLENTCRSIFDFRMKNETRLEVWSHHLAVSIHKDKSPLRLIEKNSSILGKPTTLPDWAYGTIVGLQGGTQPVLQYVDSLEANGVNISAIWIQDWVGRRTTFVGDQLRWYWQADEKRYPNFQQFCQQMNDRGIAVLGYINPMLTNDGQLYQEADSLGYLVQNHEQQTYVIQMTGFKVGLIDLSNPKAGEWIKAIIKNNMIAQGLSGWMADFGEALPWDAVLHSGVSAEEYHNQYPVEWARVNREAIQEAKMEGKVAFFSRSSFTGGGQYSTFFWAGDQMTSWQKNDGIRSIVPALTSSGISGMPINHADVGAFAGFWKLGGLFQMKRQRKLLKRHIELGAFTPIFRTHEGIIPKHNVQVYSDTEMMQFYARFSQIHASLKTYLDSLSQTAIQSGLPMIRHLYLHYPQDEIAATIVYQYLLGSDILVAPNLWRHKRKVKVYLPKGEWRHLFNNQVLEGENYYFIKAALGTPPVFIKTSSPWNKKLKF